MCKRLDSIAAMSDAADDLVKACAAAAPVVEVGGSLAAATARTLRRAFLTAIVSPADMLVQLGKIK